AGPRARRRDRGHRRPDGAGRGPARWPCGVVRGEKEGKERALDPVDADHPARRVGDCARRGMTVAEVAPYENYFGFTERPFSLTPDPRFLYRSESHANAFEVLQYAIKRREGFVVITGDIGTGKTTLSRALVERLDRKTFSALILNPFLAEDD